MNLTDLRAELTARASESDDRPADLLDGVHGKITRTKRRRLAVAGAALAVIAALAFVPALTNTSAPEPADPPSDYVKDGITLPGEAHGNTLDRGWIGREGENAIQFTWTPTVQQLALYPYCRSGEYSSYNLVVQFNGYQVHSGMCTDSGDRPLSWDPVTANSAAWISARVGKPVQVKAWLAGPDGRPFHDERAQIAVGLYTPPDTAPGAPVFQRPTAPGDYTKDGVRYRARIGGDKLAAALVGDQGQSTVKFRYTASGAPISLRSFCTASSFGTLSTEKAQYQVAVKIGAAGERTSSCYSDTTDAGTSGSITLTDLATAGRTYDVTVRLLDGQNRPVSVPRALIGLGIYEKGAQRTIDGTTLDEVIEYGEATYKVAGLTTADATKTKALTIATPADTRFLVSYGSSDLGPGSATVEVSGLSSEGHGNSSDSGGVGIGTQDESPRPATTVTLTLTEGHPTKGKLILATYVPQ